MSQKMSRRGVYSVVLFQLAIAVILNAVYSLPLEDKIEPVDLFHRCVDPEKDDNVTNKSPVLMIHGLFCSHMCYTGVDQYIADKTKRRVCSVDLRNHGDSPWNNRTDIAALTADISNFLDKRGIKKVNMIGESLGGKVSVHYTLNNPDRVDSLIVEDMRPNTIRQFGILAVKFAVRVIKNLIDSQPKGVDEKEAKEYTQRIAKQYAEQAKPYIQLPEDFLKYIDVRFINGKWQLKHNHDLLFEKMNNLKEMWTESKGLYEGPTLFLYGTQSFFKVDEDEENILKLFPNAKLIPFEGSHVIHEVHREYDDLVVNFLNEIN